MATKQTQAADINPMSIKEEIYIPVVSGEMPYVYVSLNNYTAQIPRGQMVSIPKPVADKLRERDAIEMASREYSRKEAAKATKAVTPDGDEIRL